MVPGGALAGSRLRRLEQAVGTVGTFTRAWLVMCALLYAAAFIISCRADRASLERYQGRYRVATNAVETIHQVVQPYVPAPFNVGSEAVFGLVSAVLAAWNAWQHKQIRDLKNGNGVGKTKAGN